MVKWFPDLLQNIILGILSCLIPICVSAQSEALKSILSKFKYQQENVFQEKVFAHVDRSFYLTGELIWFKIYVTDPGTQTSSNFSKVALVELLDKNSSSVVQTKVKLVEGQGDGSIIIPENLSTGTYILKIYTSYLKNLGEEKFYSQEISIVNTKAKVITQEVDSNENFKITFFPEGGNLVDNIESKIAFKLNNKFGKGISGKGFILNQKKDTIARFSSEGSGLGTFQIKPDQEESYTVFLKVKNDVFEIDDQLPKVYNHGYVMTLLDDNPDLIKIKISANFENLPNRYDALYLIGHQNSEVYVSETGNLNQGQTNFIISKNKLKNGVNFLTVFDKDGEPICERLYFKNPENKIDLSINNLSNFQSREKVSIILKNTNKQKENISDVNFSASVYLLDSLEKVPDRNIHSHFYLFSYLNSSDNIDSQIYSDTNGFNVSAVDQLLLTQGWRTFDWEQFKQENWKIDFLPEYEKQLINIKVVDNKSGLPVAGIKTSLSKPGKNYFYYQSKTNNQGIATFPADIQSGEIVFQTTSRGDSTYKISFIDDFFIFKKDSLKKYFIAEDNINALRNRHVNNEVLYTFYSAELETFGNFGTDTLPTFGIPDKIYKLDKYTRFPSMEEVLKEYVMEVFVRKSTDGYVLKLMNKKTNRVFETESLVLLDGVQILNTDKIMAFDPKKIKQVEIYPRTQYLGSMITQGVLNFATYDGNLSNYKLDPNAIIIDYKGLQAKRVFHSPDYSNEENLLSSKPDFRNLLYWNPNIQSDEKGEAKFDFFTSDQTGDYLIVINAISNDGQTGAITKVIKVENNGN